MKCTIDCKSEWSEQQKKERLTIDVLPSRPSQGVGENRRNKIKIERKDWKWNYDRRRRRRSLNENNRKFVQRKTCDRKPILNHKLYCTQNRCLLSYTHNTHSSELNPTEKQRLIFRKIVGRLSCWNGFGVSFARAASCVIYFQLKLFFERIERIEVKIEEQILRVIVPKP